jgi:epoxide hydrolase-like predicted phosphatase
MGATVIRAVIFDIGGVVLPFVAQDESHDQKWERLLNLEPATIAKRIWSHDNVRLAGTGELPSSEFLDWIANELGLNTEQELEWTEDMWNLVEFEHATANWIRSLRPQWKVAFLSNAWSDDRRELVERFSLDALADLMVISGEEGVSKPDPEIYVRTLARLGVEATDAVFVDDRPENVEAAVALGLCGVLRQSTPQMIRDVSAVLAGTDA